MTGPRGLSVLAVVALLAAGCRGGAMTSYRFSKDAESLQSTATEGSMLADGVVDGRTTSAFVLIHAQELASDTEKLASVVASTTPAPELTDKTRKLVALARRVSTQLRALSDHASDRARAAIVRSSLANAAVEVKKLEESS